MGSVGCGGHELSSWVWAEVCRGVEVVRVLMGGCSYDRVGGEFEDLMSGGGKGGGRTLEGHDGFGGDVDCLVRSSG